VYGVAADVGVNPATGSPTVTLAAGVAVATTNGSRVHVIGGAGSAARGLRGLCERGFRVSLGVAHGSDTDDLVAESLDLERVTVPPFAPIDESSASQVLRMMKAASSLIVCDPPFGPGNVMNLELATEAAKHGTPVLMLERTPIGERDLTGGRAIELWDRLSGTATIYNDPDDLVRALSG